MDYNFTEEELNIKETIRQFARNEIAPLIRQIEKEKKVPDDLIRKIMDMKISGLPFPEEWGGSGASFVSFLLAIEELSYTYLPCMFYPLICSMAGYGFLGYASHYLKEKYLRGLLTGSLNAAWAFTEPETGSDPKQLKTDAVKDGDDWILNGTKRFISNSGIADIAVIFARTERGVTAFVVETQNPGYVVGKREEFVAFDGIDNGDIILEDARVESKNILGEENKGFDILLGVEVFAKVNLLCEQCRPCPGSPGPCGKIRKRKDPQRCSNRSKVSNDTMEPGNDGLKGSRQSSFSLFCGCKDG